MIRGFLVYGNAVQWWSSLAFCLALRAHHLYALRLPNASNVFYWHKIILFRPINSEKECLPTPQRVPVNPGRQVQMNPFTWSTHVALLMQGLLTHSSISVRHDWKLSVKLHSSHGQCCIRSKQLRLKWFSLIILKWNLLVPHWSPVNPGKQLHVNLLTPFTHKPPLLHGLLAHSSRSVKQE